MNEVNSFFQPLDTSDNWNNFYIGDLETGRGLNIIKKQFNLLNKYPEANNLLVDLQEFYKDYLKLIKDEPNVEFQFYRGAGGEIESRLVQSQATKKITEFPLDAEKRMLKAEGLTEDFEGKVDDTFEAGLQVRKIKPGETDVYIKPKKSIPEILKDFSYKNTKELNLLRPEVENIFIKDFLKDYPELNKLTKLKKGEGIIVEDEYFEFDRFGMTEIQRSRMSESGKIILPPYDNKSITKDPRSFTSPTIILKSLDPSVGEEVLYLSDILQNPEKFKKVRGFNKDIINKPFDIQKLNEPPKTEKSIAGQMKSLFGYDEGGLTTSLRPFTREDSIKESNKRKNELKQLGDLEFRADLDKQLSWNPLARLGYQPDKTKVLKTDSPSFYAAYDTMVFDPDSTDESLQDSAIRMGFPEEEAKRLKSGDVFVTSDTAFNPVFSHEYTHVGLEKVFKLAKKNPKAFKEKYGEDAYGLIVTSTDDYIRDEYLTELFDDLTTKFNSLGLGDSLKVSDKFPNKSIAFTTGSDRYDDKFIDTRELFQDAIKDKDTKTTKKDVTTFNKNLKGIFGIMDAAQDILTEQGEPPKAKRKELSFYEQFKKALGFNEGGLVDTRKGTEQ